MLSELEIRHLGPIWHADLRMGPGMIAITGETGAGKSMLLSAVGLVRGGQARAQRVSAGSTETWVQAIFDAPAGSEALELAKDAGVPAEDGELFLARRVPAKGRSRSVLDGHTVPKAVLRNVCDAMLIVHGQSDQLRLVSSARQREFLDDFAGLADKNEEYQKAWEAFREADRKLASLRSQQAQARQQADYLRDSLDQITAVSPHPHEDDELREQRTRIENSAQIRDALLQAIAALDPTAIEMGDMGDRSDAPSAASLLEEARQALRPAEKVAQIAQAASQIGDISSQISDIVSVLSGQIDAGSGTDQDLDAINGRIHDLSELTRRWGPTIDDVLAWQKKAEQELEDSDASPEHLDRLAKARADALSRAYQLALAIHEQRRLAGMRLASTVNNELKSLAMDGARLQVRVSQRGGEQSLDSTGIDTVDFLFSAYPGAPEQPLDQSASGGELSRLMLALELALAESRKDAAKKKGLGSEPTFIFDEVDAGVGGEAAVELGRRLARLARSAQVIVVTHLAQVASWATTQFVVAKHRTADAAGTRGPAEDPPSSGLSEEDEDEASVTTTVTEVTGRAREQEIARMLSGSDTELSLDHARELLDSSTISATNPPASDERPARPARRRRGAAASGQKGASSGRQHAGRQSDRQSA